VGCGRPRRCKTVNIDAHARVRTEKVLIYDRIYIFDGGEAPLDRASAAALAPFGMIDRGGRGGSELTQRQGDRAGGCRRTRVGGVWRSA